MTGYPHDGTGEPSLDPGVLDTLRGALADDDLLVDVAQTFLDETPTHLDSLVLAQRSGEAERVAATAHLVKGSAVTLGALRLGRLCATLETSPQDPSRVEAVVREYGEVARALAGRLTEWGGEA